jgi:predicted peptidase
MYNPRLHRSEARTGEIAVMRLLGVVALALVLVAPTRADTGFLDRAITLHGETYRYQVYLPLEWTKAQRWPVIVVLHGDGNQGSDGMRHTAPMGMVREIRANRSRVPGVVIFPQAREGTTWGTPRMQELVLATLDDALAKLNGDENRVYLVGHSMGGQGVFRMASRWPRRFAALAAGASNAVGFSQRAIADDDRGAHPYLNSDDPFAALAAIIAKVPIWVFHSDADANVPVEQSRRVVAALKGVGAAPRYTEYQGLDHLATGQKFPTEPEFFPWLFAQRLKTATN